MTDDNSGNAPGFKNNAFQHDLRSLSDEVLIAWFMGSAIAGLTVNCASTFSGDVAMRAADIAKASLKWYRGAKHYNP